MFTKPQSLGGGDWISRDEIAGTVGSSAAIAQTTVFTVSAADPSSTTLIGVGRVLVVDLDNRRAETPTSTAAGQAAGNRSLLSGVIGNSSDLANFVVPAAVAEVRRRCGVVINANIALGQPGILQHAGPVRVLCSDTCANAGGGANGVVGGFATVSFANNNSRGTVRLAATGEPIVGQFIDVPRNAAGIATDGTTAAPQFAVVDFFGIGAFNRPAP